MSGGIEIGPHGSNDTTSVNGKRYPPPLRIGVLFSIRGRTTKMKSLDPRVQPEIRDLEFPALLLTKRWIRVYADAEALTAAWKRAVDSGAFDDALLVDSRGRARPVRRVRVLGHIGPFLGFDWYFNRSVRIAYEFAGVWERADLEAIRSRVLRQWRSPGFDDVDPTDPPGYESRLQQARDVRSLIAVLAEQYTANFERTR
jgi:hypothetical protein